MKRGRWLLLTAVALVLLLAALWLLFGPLGRRAKRVPEPEKGAPFHVETLGFGQFLKEAGCVDNPSACSSFLDPDEASLEALEAGLSWLKKRPSDESYPFAGKRVTAAQLVASLERLKAVWGLKEREEIERALDRHFTVFRLRRKADSGRAAFAALLVTGYYQPEVKGSLERGGAFQYPLYAVPADLLSVRLRDFDQALPDRTLFGRVDGHRVLPYFSRFEIDAENVLPDSLALCWLESYIDALEIQIQGSAIIELPDGARRFIHYAANNGRPYGSLGRWLIRHGYLPADGLDWPAIRAWAEENPGLLRQAMKANPRYIFFRWEDDGPLGALGFRIVPGRSAAMDPAIYPPGVPAIVRLDLPEADPYPSWVGETGKGGGKLAIMLFNHDKGSAIKGPFRLDLYCGTGPAAGALAGRLKERAELYLLLDKETGLSF